MFFATVEADHILIKDDSTPPRVFTLSDDISLINFAELHPQTQEMMCSSSMDFPFEYTTNRNVVAIANILTGNKVLTPDFHYKPTEAERIKHGISPDSAWIMVKNAIGAFPDIPKSAWIEHHEPENTTTITYVDMIPRDTKQFSEGV
jgi:hypothetical protein